MPKPTRKQLLAAQQSAYTSNEGFYQDRLVLDGSLQQLSFPDSVDEVLLATNINVAADLDNVDPVVVGNEDTTTTSFVAKLMPGDSVQIRVSNPNMVYVKGTASDVVNHSGELFRWLQ